MSWCPHASAQLHTAATQGDAASVQHWLQQGADPNHSGRHTFTPLREAMYWGNVEAAAVLVEGGADVRHPAVVSCPLGFAARHGHVGMVRAVLQQLRCGPREPREAQQPGERDAVGVAHEAALAADTAEGEGEGEGAPPAPVPWVSRRGDRAHASQRGSTTALHEAAGSGSVPIIHLLAQAGEEEEEGDGGDGVGGGGGGGGGGVFDVNAVAAGGTPLVFALQGHHTAALRALVGLGADPGVCDGHGRNLLWWSLRLGYTCVAAWLLSREDPMALVRNVVCTLDQRTVLHVAVQASDGATCCAGHVTAPRSRARDSPVPARFRVEASTVCGEPVGEGGEPVAVNPGTRCFEGFHGVAPTDLVARLIALVRAHSDDHGVPRELCVADHLGLTPLHVAAAAGRVTHVRMLVAAGCPVNPELGPCSVLRSAACGHKALARRMQVVTVLLDAGARGAETPVHGGSFGDALQAALCAFLPGRRGREDVISDVAQRAQCDSEPDSAVRPLIRLLVRRGGVATCGLDGVTGAADRMCCPASLALAACGWVGCLVELARAGCPHVVKGVGDVFHHAVTLMRLQPWRPRLWRAYPISFRRAVFTTWLCLRRRALLRDLVHTIVAWLVRDIDAMVYFIQRDEGML